jgi:centrin-1
MATRGKNVAPPAPKKPAGFNAKNYEKPGLTEDDVIEIKEAFDLFDTDGGGSIDPKGNHQRST